MRWKIYLIALVAMIAPVVSMAGPTYGPLAPDPWSGNSHLTDTSWDDLTIPAANISTNASGDPPAVVYWKDVLQLYSFANGGGKYAYMSAQLPHGWKTTTNVEPHLHFTTPDTVMPNNTVVMRLLYSTSKINDAMSDTTTIYATFTNNEAARAAIPAGSKHFFRIKPNTHLIAQATSIPYTVLGLSAVIYGRIARGPGDIYAGAVYLLSVDLHYQRDRLGSESEYSN